MVYYISLSVQIYSLMHSSLKSYHNLSDLPEFSKIFWVPIAVAFALFAFKRQLQNMSTPVFMLICKDQEDQQKLQERADKAGQNLYKWIYYLGSSVGAYLILKDTPILPWYLGGSGSLDNVFPQQ